MTILGKYSFAGGEDFIQGKYPELLHEIEEAIASVDASKCLVKESKEKTMMGKMLYSPVALNDEFEKFLHPRHWKHVKEPCEYPTQYYVGGYKPDGKKCTPIGIWTL